MDSTLVDFVKALRTAEIKVSPAETLDAMECLDLVGITDRNFLKDSLALVLSKTPKKKKHSTPVLTAFLHLRALGKSDQTANIRMTSTREMQKLRENRLRERAHKGAPEKVKAVALAGKKLQSQIVTNLSIHHWIQNPHWVNCCFQAQERNLLFPWLKRDVLPK